MLKFSLCLLLLDNKLQRWMYLLLFLNIALIISFHLIQVLEQLRISFKLSSAKMNSIISTGIILVIIKSSTSRKSSLSCLCRHLNNLNNGILSDFEWQYHRNVVVENSIFLATVVCDWESSRPRLCSNFALFNTSWQMSKVVLCCF